VETILKGILEK